MATIARRHDLWLHVDGAYGALAAMAIPERFEGLALADSLSMDARHRRLPVRAPQHRRERFS